MSSEIVKDGSVVSVHYRGTLEDGSEFDSSYSRGEAMTFQIGQGQCIPGFENGIMGLAIGESKTFTLAPEEAYGSRDESAVQPIPTASFPEGFEFQIGAMVQGENPDGGVVMATVTALDGDLVTLDFNHPMAGKTLTFAVEVENLGSSTINIG